MTDVDVEVVVAEEEEDDEDDDDFGTVDELFDKEGVEDDEERIFLFFSS